MLHKVFNSDEELMDFIFINKDNIKVISTHTTPSRVEFKVFNGNSRMSNGFGRDVKIKNKVTLLYEEKEKSYLKDTK